MGVCSTYPAITGFLTQHTLKVIDYQIYRLCQSFGTLTKFMMQKRFLDFSDSLDIVNNRHQTGQTNQMAIP